MRKRKKICIITINDLENYGNRFQNYALQEFLKSLGFSVKTLWPNDTFSFSSKLIYFARYIKHNFLGLFKSSKYKSIVLFNKFNKRIKKDFSLLSPFVSDLKQIDNKYDYFVVGSDQVWSHKHVLEFNSVLLKGINNFKKISYSASFGKDVYTQEEEKEFDIFLTDFRKISVREDSSYLKQKGICYTRNIDPVFLLSKFKWEALGKSKMIVKNYIFVYWLGPRTKELDFLLQYISTQNNNAKIIECCIYQNSYNNINLNEFLSLIKNATFMVTNSFHGTSLALIFNTPFKSIPKKGNLYTEQDLRFSNLKEIFNLDIKTFDYSSYIPDFNWNYINNKINKEREISINYFEEFLHE